MKAILFDLDGTLLDTLEDLYLSVNHSLHENDFPPRTLREIRRFLGNGAAYLIQKSIPNGEDEHFESVFSDFREYYAVHSGDHTCPYPGIPSLIENLQKKGYLLAILSNKPDFAVQTLCREHFPQIRHCIGETAEIPRKPNPTGVLKMAERLGVKLEDCLYVGDSEVDIQTAKNANIPCVAVTWGFRDMEDLEQEGALHFAADTVELEQKIDEIFQD